MPPLPALLGVLVGASLLGRARGAWADRARRRLGWLVLLPSLALLWLGTCTGTAWGLQQWLLRPPPALTPADIEALRLPGSSGPSKPAAALPATRAIVVLGGGRQAQAPEYAGPMLTALPMARLHYAITLARRTGLPLAYSGGVGWAQDSGPTEAAVAAQVAERDYDLRIRWLEDRSRDTRENARYTVELLRAAGVRELVVVTHASHMRRALRAFAQAAEGTMAVSGAPMGFVTLDDRFALDWMPSGRGAQEVHAAWHEVMGLLTGR